MPNYRRTYQEGGIFFFTLVTHQRQHLFLNSSARKYLRKSIAEEQAQHPFNLTAIVLLPEHLHCIWEKPKDDADYSKRWGRIKSKFTKMCLAHGAKELLISRTRNKHRERGVWQKRFWEHRIRDEEDFIRHVNYIHFNPVKHGLAHCPHKWPYSSFARWVEQGYYKQNWLCDCSGQGSIKPELSFEDNTFGQ